jgi:hypothetical protein
MMKDEPESMKNGSTFQTATSTCSSRIKGNSRNPNDKSFANYIVVSPFIAFASAIDRGAVLVSVLSLIFHLQYCCKSFELISSFQYRFNFRQGSKNGFRSWCHELGDCLSDLTTFSSASNVSFASPTVMSKARSTPLGRISFAVFLFAIICRVSPREFIR